MKGHSFSFLTVTQTIGITPFSILINVFESVFRMSLTGQLPFTGQKFAGI
jgi:hypothetical protein